MAAWARVSILLNLGDVPAATTAAIAASALTHWYRRYGDHQCVDSAARVYDSGDLPVGWMWFEPDRGRVLVSSDVVSHYGLSPQLYRFAATVTRLEGPAFRWFDLDNWKVETDIQRRRLGFEPI